MIRRLQVDGARSIPRVRSRAPRLALLAWLALFATACARQPSPGRIEPGLEPRLVASTQPATHRLLLFRWSLREGQSRFSGAGAARIAPDERARLDLFGPQDVPYLSAILRGDRLALPSGVPARVIPPAPLLWSALGVIRPPAGATLVSASGTDSEASLAYSTSEGVWSYTVRGGVLVGAEWQSSGGERYTVELEGTSRGAQPERALYRDWQEYRELVLELEEQEDVEGFPPETWILEAR